jgi:hypothetical protein
MRFLVSSRKGIRSSRAEIALKRTVGRTEGLGFPASKA